MTGPSFVSLTAPRGGFAAFGAFLAALFASRAAAAAAFEAILAKAFSLRSSFLDAQVLFSSGLLKNPDGRRFSGGAVSGFLNGGLPERFSP